ncbi:SIR2 family NAD-dependent protein deacylase, partial [Methylobacterium radiotolerans]
KYHGDLAHPETVIFSGRSYANRISDTRHFLNIRMQADLLAKGFLFVGYSFQDPNIHLIFRELAAAFGGKMPPSYLIAYRYAPAMEDLTRDFGVKVIDPAASFPDAKSHDEAFKRYLASLSEKVLRLQTQQDLATILEPSAPMAARVATEFDVAAVVADAATGDFKQGLKTYRALLDRAAIPEGLERNALEAFKRLCDAARTEEDLGNLAGAIFNLGLPPGEGAEAISRFMVAVNRLNFSSGFPSYLLACPRYPDYVVPVAAAMAVAEIKDAGDRVGEAFRIQADAWMIAFHKLPDHLQSQVKAAMEIAWKDAGQSVPRSLFNKSGPFAMKSFDDFMSEMRDRIPKFTKPPHN